MGAHFNPAILLRNAPGLPSLPPAEYGEQVNRALRRLERGTEALASLDRAITGRLPVAEAESLMDDIEDHMAAIKAKLAGAHGIIGAEYDRIFNTDEDA
jgi:hypothetical protein